MTTRDLEPWPLTVVEVTDESAGVRSFQLAAPEGGPLPDWEPGAHLEVVLPSGIIRQYSLCGDPKVNDRYRIAVLREPESRGGSIEMHDSVGPGATLRVRGPRNHFALVPAPSYLFVAGGVGITPILAMVRDVSRRGVPWRLVYGGRTRASMAFLDEIAALSGGSVEILAQDERGLLPLLDEVKGADPESLVYACGPESLLVALEGVCAENGSPGRLHLERFGPTADSHAGPEEGDGSFEVELSQTGVVLTVPGDRTILEVVREAVPTVLSSCEEGFCGTCETGVLDGIPEHRDTVLDDDEKAANDTMMICVGRSKSPRLVLDI